MIAEKTSNSESRRSTQSPQSHSTTPPLDATGALWRYRWAVILPAIVFGVIGFLVYLQTEETFRSTTRLMVESNRPPILYAMTGEVIGGVPNIDVLEAQLYSDTVAEMAFNHPRMKPFQELYESDLTTFVKDVQHQLELEPEVTDIKTAASLVAQLHFDSPDPAHCEAAIEAYSEALQAYYNERHKSTRVELIGLIEKAINDLSPRLTEMERRYGEFRRDAPLSWDSEGKAINPHREQKLYLTKLRSEKYEELRREQTILKSMESVADQATDPRIALNVMTQLLGVKISSPAASRGPDPIVGDTLLAEIDLEKKLLPLIVERNRNEREFGSSHPTVRALDNELETTRSELLRLVREQADRITKLRQEWFQDLGDPIDQASKTVDAVLYSKNAEVEMLQAHIKDLDEQIANEKIEAAKLSKAEQQNEQMLREIDPHRELMRQLEENMGRAKLSDEESVTQIVELWKPTSAYLVGPSLLIFGGGGTLLGLLLGSGLALLLEKNANTFRDPSEISSHLETPVLTHIPFFRGKRRKTKKGEVDPYKTLSTDVAVVHQPSSITAEAIRSLRTAVFFDLGKSDGGKVLQITSPLPGDGKSTIACNLACSIAQSGKRVLAIDCDLRRPQMTDNFDCSDKLGLTNVLNGECDPLDATHSTPLPKLSIMPSGPIPSNPAEALSLPVTGELLDYLREHFDYIILDTPPLLVVTDPSITASIVDAVVMTLRVRRKSKPNAVEALNILKGVGANILGVVVNNSDEGGSADGYRGYGYYKYGGYGGQYYRRNNAPAGTSVAISNGNLRRVRTGESGGGPNGKPAVTAVVTKSAASRHAASGNGAVKPNAERDSSATTLTAESEPATDDDGPATDSTSRDTNA